MRSRILNSYFLIVNCAFLLPSSAFAADHFGQVTFSGQPVPGATVTASRGDRQVVTSTDAQGVYRLESLPDGAWSIKVEMLGFSTLEREVDVGADGAPATWELALLPFAEITQRVEAARPAEPQAGSSDGTAASSTPAAKSAGAGQSGATPQGFRRAGVNAAAPPPVLARAEPGAFAEPQAAEAAMGAADGFLIN